jgi:hypothetical protein
MPKGGGAGPIIGTGDVGGVTYDDPVAGNFPDSSQATSAGSPGDPGASQYSLGAALLSLSSEESAPNLGGGLSLYALQNRRLARVEGRVSKLEQEA